MKECRRRGVDYLVAPYESDAQLAYLSRVGHVHAVVTEDTDLVLFGCQKVATRYSLLSTLLDLISFAYLHTCLSFALAQLFIVIQQLSISRRADNIQAGEQRDGRSAGAREALISQSAARLQLNEAPSYVHPRWLRLPRESARHRPQDRAQGLSHRSLRRPLQGTFLTTVFITLYFNFIVLYILFVKFSPSFFSLF